MLSPFIRLWLLTHWRFLSSFNNSTNLFLFSNFHSISELLNLQQLLTALQIFVGGLLWQKSPTTSRQSHHITFPQNFVFSRSWLFVTNHVISHFSAVAAAASARPACSWWTVAAAGSDWQSKSLLSSMSVLDKNDITLAYHEDTNSPGTLDARTLISFGGFPLVGDFQVDVSFSRQLLRCLFLLLLIVTQLTLMAQF